MSTYYDDGDGDGCGDPGDSTSACSQPGGYVANNNDCDDSNPATCLSCVCSDCGVYPACYSSYTTYKDVDGDGYSDGVSNFGCSTPANYYSSGSLTATSGDCDDSDPCEYPNQVWYLDADRDHYYVSSTVACTRPSNNYVTDVNCGAAYFDQYGNNDCNDADPNINPGMSEVCDYVDQDCDGVTDEGTAEAKCFRTPECTGMLDCDSFSAALCPDGCLVEPLYGRCSDVGNYCVDNGDCSSGTCDGFGGYECVEGFASCTQFINDWICDSYSGDGCSRACDDDWSMEACESLPDPTGGSCQFTCEPPDFIPAYEVCGNGIDDDGDGDVDCDDSDCQVPELMVLSVAEVVDLNCLGSNMTGNYTANWYCGVALSDESVGLCCEDDFEPVRSIFGSWSCVDTEPCDPALGYSCDYYYDSDFSSWINSVGASTDASWCVAPLDGRACCSVVHFANFEYWDDAATGNVKIY